MAAQRELGHEAVWLFVDSVVPLTMSVQAKMVVSASFNGEVSKVSKATIHSFVWQGKSCLIALSKHILLVLQLADKGKFHTLYRPVWSWQETEAARPIYPDVKVAQAREFYDKFGGVVRYSSEIVSKLHAQQDFLLQQALILQACPRVGQPAMDPLAG